MKEPHSPRWVFVIHADGEQMVARKIEDARRVSAMHRKAGIASRIERKPYSQVPKTPDGRIEGEVLHIGGLVSRDEFLKATEKYA